MNKMLNPNGGVPLKLTDIVYMQDAVRESFKALLNAFSTEDGNARLAGCVVTRQDTSDGNEKISWTAGWIALHGEIFSVASGEIASTEKGTFLYWKITRVQEAVVTLGNGEQGARREKSYATLVVESLKDDTSVSDNEVLSVLHYVSIPKASKKLDVYIDSVNEGLVLPSVTLTTYQDGSTGIVLAGPTISEVTLSGGLYVKYRESVSFQGLGFITDVNDNVYSAVMIQANNGNIYLKNVDGTPVTRIEANRRVILRTRY